MKSPLYDSYSYFYVLQPIKQACTAPSTHIRVAEENKTEKEKRVRLNYLSWLVFGAQCSSTIFGCFFRCVSYCLRRSSLHSVSHHLLLIIGTTSISAVFFGQFTIDRNADEINNRLYCFFCLIRAFLTLILFGCFYFFSKNILKRSFRTNE